MGLARPQCLVQLRRAQLCFDEIETGILTLELGAKTSRKRQSFAGTQGGSGLLPDRYEAGCRGARRALARRREPPALTARGRLALLRASVEFIDENGGGPPGVRLRKRRQKLTPLPEAASSPTRPVGPVAAACWCGPQFGKS
jgi:hypothetical protein